jgi:hypothetical protein
LTKPDALLPAQPRFLLEKKPSEVHIRQDGKVRAMMILGFAGIGFMAYRRKQNGPALRVA